MNKITRILTTGALAIATATLVAFSLAGTANAQVPQYQNRADAKRFAINYWTGRGQRNPCTHAGGIHVHFYRFSRVPSLHNVFGYAPNFDSCDLYMDSDVRWNWYKLCTITTHEVGHIFYHHHTPGQPASIMYPTFPNPVWGWHFSGCEYTYE